MKSLPLRILLSFPANAVLAIFAMVALRMALHGSLQFAFLPWNIFLALLPLAFAHAAARSRNLATGILLSAAWLVLFPNAAYLVTDIVHLRIRPGRLFWLDLILLFAAGVLGVVLSLRSLRSVEKFYGRFLPRPWLTLLSICFLAASAYGIYLGRVERWNSWDALARPFALFNDIFDDFRHPIRNRDAWELTALFAILQIGSYCILRSLPAKQVTRPD